MRLYVATFAAVAVAAQQDLFELVAAAGKPLLIHGFELGQSSENGDAQDENLAILLKRGQTTSGSGGSAAAAPAVLDPSMSTAGFTFEANNTTKASAGTIVTLYSTSWSVRTPSPYIFTPELRPFVPASGRATLELATTPADSITMQGTMWVEELG